MISIKSHFMKMTITVLVLLLPAAYPVAGYGGFCKQICEKHRTTDDAYTLDCDNYREDHNCRRYCWFCQDMCTDHTSKKVYSCPENPDKKTEAGGIGMVIIIVIAVAIVGIICIAGISCCVFFGMRNRRGRTAVVGGRGMGAPPPYSAMSQQTMNYPTASTVQSMSSQQQYQTTSVSASASSTI